MRPPRIYGRSDCENVAPNFKVAGEAKNCADAHKLVDRGPRKKQTNADGQANMKQYLLVSASVTAISPLEREPAAKTSLPMLMHEEEVGESLHEDEDEDDEENED